MPPFVDWTRHDVISRYHAGETIEELSKSTGHGTATIQRYFRRQGVKCRRPGPRRFYNLNESFFDSIDNELKAYWLGFILADGSVRQTGSGNWVLGIELADVDKHHLVKLAAALGTDSPLRSRTNNKGSKVSRLVVSSNKICKALISLEVTSNKTGRHGTPVIPDELLRHMYRGHTDGDGSFFYCKTTKSWCHDSVGSEKFMLDYQSWLMNNAALSKTKPVQRGPVISIRYSGGRQVEKIARLLYDGSTVSLDRKYDLYLDILDRKQWSDARKQAADNRQQVEALAA